MNLLDIIKQHKIILTEGSVVERIRRNPSLALSEHLSNSLLIYDEAGRKELTNIYKEYINIAQSADLPILILTPTWRANKDRIEKAGCQNIQVNEDNFKFLNSIRNAHDEYSTKIMIGGLIGCANDAYNSEQALSLTHAEEFHSWQLEKLYKAGVDFFIASTLPNMMEAAGIAKAMSKFDIPYIISFIIRTDGTLLDGMPLHNAIFFIDSMVNPKPAWYMINCVHPSVLKKAMIEESAFIPILKERIVGIQANTSSLSPEELDGAVHLQCEDPATFADGLLELHREYGFKILGGCCGTDDRHIRAVAEKYH